MQTVHDARNPLVNIIHPRLLIPDNILHNADRDGRNLRYRIGLVVCIKGRLQRNIQQVFPLRSEHFGGKNERKQTENIHDDKRDKQYACQATSFCSCLLFGGHNQSVDFMR